MMNRFLSISQKYDFFYFSCPHYNLTTLKPCSNQPLLKCEYFEKYVVKLAENSH